jgi:hypothetical protein
MITRATDKSGQAATTPNLLWRLPPEKPAGHRQSHPDPLNWDWDVCHTYYFLWSGMGNVSNMIWDGDNPPPKPGPPMGLYCDPATLTNCRIANHP